MRQSRTRQAARVRSSSRVRKSIYDAILLGPPQSLQHAANVYGRGR